MEHRIYFSGVVLDSVPFFLYVLDSTGVTVILLGRYPMCMNGPGRYDMIVRWGSLCTLVRCTFAQ